MKNKFYLIITIALFTIKLANAQGWVPQYVGGTLGFLDVHFTDANNGWVVGIGKGLYHTTNGGTTWTAKTTPAVAGNGNFYKIFFVDANTGWIVEDKTLLKTIDGGATWNVANTPHTGYLTATFANANDGILKVGTDSMFKTNDGGATWIPITNPNTSNLGSMRIYQGSYIISGNNAVLQSTDGGVTWTTTYIPAPTLMGGLVVTSATSGIIPANKKIFVADTNLNTWTSVPTPDNSSIFCASALDVNSAIAGGYAGPTSIAKIVRTTDGGATWTVDSIYGATVGGNFFPGAGSLVQGIQYVDRNTAFAVGSTSNGYILKYDPNAVGTPLAIASVNKQNNFTVYPNPASNTITINPKYVDKNASVFIYNMAGKLLLQQNFISNSIDVSGLPSGLFFIQLISKNETYYSKFTKL